MSEPREQVVADIARRSKRAFVAGVVGTLCLFPLLPYVAVQAVGIRRDCVAAGVPVPQRAMAAFVLGTIGGLLWLIVLVVRLLS